MITGIIWMIAQTEEREKKEATEQRRKLYSQNGPWQ